MSDAIWKIETSTWELDLIDKSFECKHWSKRNLKNDAIDNGFATDLKDGSILLFSTGMTHSLLIQPKNVS